MKTTINWQSRTVISGLVMIAMGFTKIFLPEYVSGLEGAPEYFISAGILAVFVKS